MTPDTLTAVDESVLGRIGFDLLGDPDLAEETVQLTRITAARKSPRDPAAAGGWLRRIARHRALRLRDERARRERLHRAAAEVRRGNAPATVDVVARQEVAALVEEAVARLDPPFREVVRLRYFEGLPPRKIAARRGIPVATVRSRLQRALQKMRGDLDRRSADRRVWRAALAPLALRPARVAPWSIWAGAALVIVATAGAIVAATEAAAPEAEARSDRVAAEPSSVAAETADLRERHDAAGTVAGARTPVASTAAGRRRGIVPPNLVQGFVRDERDEPVAHATIFQGSRPEDLRATDVRTDESGWFSITVHDGGGMCFAATAPGHHPSRAVLLTPVPYSSSPDGHIKIRSAQHVKLQLRRGGMAVRGRVTAPDGTPVEDVRVFAGRDRSEHLPEVWDASWRGTTVISTRTDAAGLFELMGVPPGWCGLAADSRGDFGVAHATVAGDPGAVLTVDFQLAPAADLVVRVVDAGTGLPVDGRVMYAPAGSVGRVWTYLDDDGVGCLDALPADRDCAVLVEADDGRRFRQVVRGWPGAERTVTVRLPSLLGATTRGTVHLLDGEPMIGGLVRLRSASDPHRVWTATTGEDGSFAVADGPEVFDLEVLDDTDPGELPLLFLRGLRRSDVALSLEVEYAETGLVQGRLVRRDGGDPERIDLRVQHESGAMGRRIGIDADGVFEIDYTPPGVYELVAITPAGTRCDLGRVELHRGVDHNLGDVLVPEPGTVSFADRGPADPASTFVVRNARGVAVAAGRGPLPAALSLAPGRYRVERDGRVVHEIEVRSGRTTRS